MPMSSPVFEQTFGESPLLAAAIHNGHELRPEIRERVSLKASERLREEDPFTALWTRIAPNRFIGCRSRFETDLNRPREKAVYLVPEDAWGLHVWKEELAEELIRQSLWNYDCFYRSLELTIRQLLQRYPRLVMFDLHTYNHRRDGADGAPASPIENPEINIGTGSLEGGQWDALVDRFIADLSGFDYAGRQLDVRENVKFQGGEMSRWIHRTFPGRVCSLSIEVKKFFMDEWTGIADERQLELIGQALASTVPGVLAELGRLGP